MSGKRVLVIGSTGAMGHYVTKYLLEMGHYVTGVALDDQRLHSDRLTHIKANARDLEFLRPLVEQKFDGIVDFMSYPPDAKRFFTDYYKLYLDNTDHYIFLSSCRVYADEEVPVRETSPRLLDVSKDEALLASNDYCMHKARAEDLLWASGYKNFSIVSPATVLSDKMFKLVTLEATNTIGRARKGKKVVLPMEAQDKPATLSWAGDVSRMIAGILFKEEAMGEAFNVCSAESQTWGKIAEYYKEFCGVEIVWIPKEDYLKIVSKDGTVEPGARWQLEYARLFHRITDNSKVLKVAGLKQEDCMPLYDALKMTVDAFPEDYVFADNAVDARMDAYLAEKGR